MVLYYIPQDAFLAARGTGKFCLVCFNICQFLKHGQKKQKKMIRLDHSELKI